MAPTDLLRPAHLLRPRREELTGCIRVTRKADSWNESITRHDRSDRQGDARSRLHCGEETSRFARTAMDSGRGREDRHRFREMVRLRFATNRHRRDRPKDPKKTVNIDDLVVAASCHHCRVGGMGLTEKHPWRPGSGRESLATTGLMDAPS